MATKFVAVAIKTGILIVLSRPCSYNTAKQFKPVAEELWQDEDFKVMTVSKVLKSDNVIGKEYLV
jgi:hypothetical protein